MVDIEFYVEHGISLSNPNHPSIPSHCECWYHFTRSTGTSCYCRWGCQSRASEMKHVRMPKGRVVIIDAASTSDRADKYNYVEKLPDLTHVESLTFAELQTEFKEIGGIINTDSYGVEMDLDDSVSAAKDILTKEIESWAGFEYALRKENRTLFEEMLDRCKKTEYVDCAAATGESSRETLVLVLIFEQHELIRRLGKADRIYIQC